MDYLKRAGIVFFAIVIANILVEFLFEGSINNLINVKFLLLSILVSLLCAVILKKELKLVS